MQGWGHALLSMGLGLVLAAGCGGRTDALFEEGGYGSTSGTGAGGASAGKSNGAGAPSRAGSSSVGGAPGAGGVPIGGSTSGGRSMGGFGGVSTGGRGGGYGGVYSAGAGSISSGGFGGDGLPQCIGCLQQSCTEEAQECLWDTGCFRIFSCVGATGCNGLQCYRPQYCKDVIDRSGGLDGASMRLVTQTLTCAARASCPCPR